MAVDETHRLPNSEGANVQTFDPRTFKAHMIIRVAEKLKDLGEGMQSCHSDEQFGRMAQAKNEFQKAQDKEWLEKHNIHGMDQKKFLEMLEFSIHNVFNAANQSIRVGK